MMRFPFPFSASFTRLFALFCCFAIAGCSQINPFAKEQDGPRLCPELAIHELAQQNDIYLPGSKRDPVDLRYAISFDDIQGECSLNDETVTFDLTLYFTARQGPAFEGGYAEFDFVIAWVAPSGKIVFTDEFTHSFEFVENYREVKLTRPYQNVMTIGANEKAAEYSLLAALKIDKATLRSRLK